MIYRWNRTTATNGLTLLPGAAVIQATPDGPALSQVVSEGGIRGAAPQMPAALKACTRLLADGSLIVRGTPRTDREGRGWRIQLRPRGCLPAKRSVGRG